MGSETRSCPINAPQEASNSDEYFLQHSLLFAESLKDLRNLRMQLYSAAEYFESSYEKHEYKQLVVETLKDYASKALISTVDHLGSVAYKVNSFLDEKVNEISAARLQFSCLEQRLRTSREFIDGNGLLQQSLVIKTPRHHKHYTIPESKFISKFESLQNVCSFSPQDDKHLPKQGDCHAKAFQGPVTKPHPPTIRRGHSRQTFNEVSPRPLSFSFMRFASCQEVGKRTASPFRLPLKRSGSVANRSTSPNSSAGKQRCPSEPRRAISLYMKPETNKGKAVELYTRKSKHLFKALLSFHQSRKQGLSCRFKDDK